MLADREKPRKPARRRVAGTCGGNMTASEQASKQKYVESGSSFKKHKQVLSMIVL